MIFNYLFKKNKVIQENPSFTIGRNKLKDQMTNFDLWHIPSNVLLSDLKKLGFRIKFFSTNKESILESEKYKAFSRLRKTLAWIYLQLNFFPFNHLGPTTILMVEKPQIQ